MMKEVEEKHNLAKEFLQQVKLFDLNIDSLLEEKAQLEALRDKITSSWGGEPVSGSGNKDRLGETSAKILDLERKIDKAVDEFVDKKEEVRAVIAKVQHPIHLELLLKVYIHYHTLEKVAGEMGYSYRNVCYLHGRALQTVTEILKGD